MTPEDFFSIPLAQRLRPGQLDDFIGQEELMNSNSILRNMIEKDNLSSFILWGPPGTGKTSIAGIIQKNASADFVTFSAVTSSIKDVKAIMDQYNRDDLLSFGKKLILFIDEIHRFNKAQQDAFLSYVENGSIILIGATTENPSFSVISPLLSRLRVFILKQLNDEDIKKIIDKARETARKELGSPLEIEEKICGKIISVAGGDARRCLGILEMGLKYCIIHSRPLEITDEILDIILQGRLPSYDKKGDFHYDFISALHKSMRNSDVDAACYYAVKMMLSGEDPLYIMRRVIQFATEDVGLADPNALTISIAARQAVEALGMPEAQLAIVEAVAYNALAPKSNSTYTAFLSIKADIQRYPDLPVPLQIRNAPTNLMKDAGYGKEYKYAHDYTVPVTNMQCLPDRLKDKTYYHPGDFGFEKNLKARIEKINEIKGKKQS